jgi:hypothetical protein
MRENNKFRRVPIVKKSFEAGEITESELLSIVLADQQFRASVTEDAGMPPPIPMSPPRVESNSSVCGTKPQNNTPDVTAAPKPMPIYSVIPVLEMQSPAVIVGELFFEISLPRRLFIYWLIST